MQTCVIRIYLFLSYGRGLRHLIGGVAFLFGSMRTVGRSALCTGDVCFWFGMAESPAVRSVFPSASVSGSPAHMPCPGKPIVRRMLREQKTLMCHPGGTLS